jgi:hypothetical protein
VDAKLDLEDASLRFCLDNITVSITLELFEILPDLGV